MAQWVFPSPSPVAPPPTPCPCWADPLWVTLACCVRAVLSLVLIGLRWAAECFVFPAGLNPREEGRDSVPPCVPVVVPDTVDAQTVGAGGQK